MSRTRRMVTWFVDRLATKGTLEVTTPGNITHRIGSGLPNADVTFATKDAVLHTLRNGVTGFSEGYMDGTVTTSSLPDLLRWAAVNHDAWYQSALARALHRVRKLWARIRPERRHPRVQSMTDHYNLGNDFYATWLDPSMTYSSARFAHPDQPLEEAQRHKYGTIARHAGLEPGMNVLEIGCGWGGFAAYAAGELGCTVVGVTIAEEQADHARKHISELGLADRVDIRLQDFRETVSRICTEIDEQVAVFRTRRLDHLGFPYVFVDATYVKARVDHHIVSRAVVVATGVACRWQPGSPRT